jgi:hypothetical protein
VVSYIPNSSEIIRKAESQLRDKKTEMRVLLYSGYPRIFGKSIERTDISSVMSRVVSDKKYVAFETALRNAGFTVAWNRYASSNSKHGGDNIYLIIGKVSSII